MATLTRTDIPRKAGWASDVNTDFNSIVDYIGSAAGSLSTINGRLAVELNADGTSKAKGSAADLTTRLAVELNADGTSKAKGSAADLTTRLAVAINNDGTLKAGVSASEWVAGGDTPVYVDATNLYIAGDVSAVYVVGRKIKTYYDSNNFYHTILTSSYNSGTDRTEIEVDIALNASITGIDYSIITLNSTPETIGITDNFIIQTRMFGKGGF